MAQVVPSLSGKKRWRASFELPESLVAEELPDRVGRERPGQCDTYRVDVGSGEFMHGRTDGGSRADWLVGAGETEHRIGVRLSAVIGRHSNDCAPWSTTLSR